MSITMNCPTCGAPRRVIHDTDGTSHFARADGTHEALADAMDAYHAVNLLQALRLVPDTGDWHGSLRIVCSMTLERVGMSGVAEVRPNQTAEQMAERAAVLCSELHGEAYSDG